MKDAFISFSRFTAMISLCILSILGTLVFSPPEVQAANFGSLTDNGTAAYMGIGITPAVRPLHLFGNVALFQRNQDSAGFIIQRTDTNRWVLGVNESGALGNGFVLSTYPVGVSSSIPRLLVTQQGRVGIGTVSPYVDTRLTVINDNLTPWTTAVYGETVGDNDTWGCAGYSTSNESAGLLGGSMLGGGVPLGIYGYSSAFGIYGEAGVLGVAGLNNVYENLGVLGTPDSGVYGTSRGSGKAAIFDGNVQVNGSCNITGTLYKTAGAFRIDHPLDPEHKVLQHSFVESPDMKNVYDGVATCDAGGMATVALPSYFEALNRDFRYQLTCLGGYAPVYVAEKIRGNSFRIAGGTPGLEVSWQVTGTRQDPYAADNPIVVELEKPAGEAGQFLYPAGYGRKQARSPGWPGSIEAGGITPLAGGSRWNSTK